MEHCKVSADSTKDFVLDEETWRIEDNHPKAAPLDFNSGGNADIFLLKREAMEWFEKSGIQGVTFREVCDAGGVAAYYLMEVDTHSPKSWVDKSIDAIVPDGNKFFTKFNGVHPAPADWDPCMLYRPHPDSGLLYQIWASPSAAEKMLESGIRGLELIPRSESYFMVLKEDLEEFLEPSE